MKTALISGSCGLIGGEAAKFYLNKGFLVLGIDNDSRKTFFGSDASTSKTRQFLEANYKNYRHYNLDIRDFDSILDIFKTNQIDLIIHTAAQPSHDWAAKAPLIDFSINAQGTLNLLEATRQFSQEAVFIFTSTNKVYGDLPNALPLLEEELRYELQSEHRFFKCGINESMSLDQSTHSLFGVSKVAADLLVQEYGRYFGLKTACFRGGCLTGPGHSGAELHGFLAYLVKATLKKIPYNIYGYLGKQVRDNIHASDLIKAFDLFYQKPKSAAVYNIGGSRLVNCSMLEAIKLCETLCDQKLNYTYIDQNRIADHIWWISDISHFLNDYPKFSLSYSLTDIISEIRDAQILK